MNSLTIFAFGALALATASALQPIRGWLKDLLSQRYLMIFIVPIMILFGWPRDNMEAFRDGDDLGILRVVRMVLFLGFFVLTLIAILPKQRLSVPRSGVLALFALYTLLAALSALYSMEPLQSLWKAFELIVIVMFAAVLYAQHKFRPWLVVGLTNALLYLAFSLCLMSLVGAVLAPELAWRDFGLTGLGVRSMSGVVPMLNPNMLGQLGGIVGLVGILRLLTPGSRMMGDWLISAVGVLILFLAYSRTSLIAFAFLLFLLLILLRRQNILLLVLPIMFFLAPVFYDFIFDYFARGQNVEQLASFTGRTLMWEAALEAWWESPWLGHGFFVGHKYVEYGKGFLATTDNTYVETLVNLGVAGLVLIVAFAMGVLRLALRVLKASRDRKSEMLPTAITLFIFVTFILMRSLTASSFQVLHHNLLFFTVAISALLIMDNFLLGSKPR